MNEEIVLSDELWNYYASMEEICQSIHNIYALAMRGAEIIYNGSAYEGGAKNELIFFMASFTGHIQKLEMLYIAAYTYLINTFQEKCDEDELLAWTINHIYDSMSF